MVYLPSNRYNRLPKEFSIAGRILKAVKIERKSLNNELYNSAIGRQNISKITRLVAKALRHSDELDSMYEFLRSKYDDNFQYDFHKTSILLVELFWGSSCLPEKDHELIKVLNENAEELSNFVTTSSDDTEHLGNKVSLPRYARINVLKATEGYVLRHLQEEGWELQESGPSYSKYLQNLASLAEPYFMRDFHYPELLAFPAGTQLHQHPLYISGAIVMQAKSTCIPVKLLNPQPGSVVLDMCAAPGMKTSQLAAHMNNIGEIHAVELDPNRYQTLQQILQAAGVTCAQTYNKDVLEVRPHHIPNVTHILVDPSCSGSGMQRIEMQPKTTEQVQKLANFQFRVLCLALTFPQVRRIVYSTCSVLPVENEAVVSEALEYMGHTFKVVDAWSDPQKGQLTRGDPSYPGGDLCIYLHPDPDLCTGFFVAVLERNSKKKRKHKEEVEESQEEPQEKKIKRKHLKVEESNDTSTILLGSTELVQKTKRTALNHSDSDCVEDVKKKKKQKTEPQLKESTCKKHKRKNDKYVENQESGDEGQNVNGKRKKDKIQQEADEQHDLSNSVIEGKKKRKHKENEKVNSEGQQILSEPIKDKNKKKKDIEHADIENDEQQILPEPVREKKNKKKSKELPDIENDEQQILPEPVKDKKKKKKDKEHADIENDEQQILPEPVKDKKKKKKDKEHADIENDEQQILPEPVKDKKKKKKDKEHADIENDEQQILPEPVKDKKKKKKDKEHADIENDEQHILPEPVSEKKNKNKGKELADIENDEQHILPEPVREKKNKKGKIVDEVEAEGSEFKSNKSFPEDDPTALTTKGVINSLKRKKEKSSCSKDLKDEEILPFVINSLEKRSTKKKEKKSQDNDRESAALETILTHAESGKHRHKKSKKN